MSDIDSGLDGLQVGDEDAPLAPAREGLPPRYRMRADAHYVEQLDSALFNAPIRFMDVRTIDSPRPDDGPNPSAAFVESIKRYGVLQPLLVRSRSGRHVVIAGRKRLAAAVAAGLREVPCLVERVDDDEAQVLAVASNVSANEPAGVRPSSAPVQTDAAFGLFAECLTAVASSAHLLSPGSTLTQNVAVDLVRAEAARALHLLVAMRVLRDDAKIARKVIRPAALLERAIDRTSSERALRGIQLEIDATQSASVTIRGDEELLTSAAASLVMATAVLLDSARGSTITLRVTTQSDHLTLTAIHDGAELPHHWRSKLAADWSESVVQGVGSNTAFVLLHAARRIAELHDGHMALDCSEGRTSVSLVVPVSASN